MSNPRYDWWTYAKGMIRRYPQLKREYEDLHTMGTTSNYSGMPRSFAGRTLECISLRELPLTSQREYEAVRRAIQITQRYANAKDRLYVIDGVFWRQSHSLQGMALLVPCHYKTAQGWHNVFIRLVAKEYGLMDEDGSPRA